MKLAATIIGKATDQIIDKGRKIAGILLEAAEADLDFAAGRYRVTGTDREVRLFLSVPKSAVLKDEAKKKRRKSRHKKAS